MARGAGARRATIAALRKKHSAVWIHCDAVAQVSKRRSPRSCCVHGARRRATLRCFLRWDMTIAKMLYLRMNECLVLVTTDIVLCVAHGVCLTTDGHDQTRHGGPRGGGTRRHRGTQMVLRCGGAAFRRRRARCPLAEDGQRRRACMLLDSIKLLLAASDMSVRRITRGVGAGGPDVALPAATTELSPCTRLLACDNDCH